MEKKSLGVNFIFSCLKTLMGVVFPLITFPYATRVLGPEYLGKIDYAQANMTYFTLIAAFGISGYAVREGSRIRDDRDKINKFAGEMLAINMITVMIAYVLCFAALFIPKFKDYRGLMLIFSTTIILTAFGMEWIYNIYEDYQYITIRSFIFQVISVVLLFTCVKTAEDYIKYAVILVISSVGSNIMNLIRCRKYIRLKIRFGRGLFTHIKPMTYIFVMNIAASIYLVMDRSMLGYISGDDVEVGLYSAAIKITAVLTSLMAAVRTVTTPRVAYFVQNDVGQAEKLNYMTAKVIFMLSIPCSIGMFVLGSRVLVLFAGEAYGGAAFTLRILLVDMVIASINGFLINQLFISYRRDRWASIAVILGAVANLIMNSITIPVLGKEGAALSTCFSELVIFVFACIMARDIFKIVKVIPQIIQSIIACVPMILIYICLVKLGCADIVIVLFTILAGALMYFIILRLMKNELVLEACSYIKK